jgi:hypothetical protein
LGDLGRKIEEDHDVGIKTVGSKRRQLTDVVNR